MKAGFIGVGNMGGAILGGVIRSGFLPAEALVVYDVSEKQCKAAHDRYGVAIAGNIGALVDACDVILLCVKPIYMKEVLLEAKPHAGGKRFISIAAGWTYGMLTDVLDEASGARVLRVMPNTPAMVGEGYTALCQRTGFTAEEFEWAKALFSTLGKAEAFPEALFDAVVAVSGSSPAYVYMLIEAMADGAVAQGMPRAAAIQAAAQAVLGSARMVLETGEHPAKLKDAVCSPAGTTIDAVEALEKDGFRYAVLDAMRVCAEKSRRMGKPADKKENVQ